MGQKNGSMKVGEPSSLVHTAHLVRDHDGDLRISEPEFEHFMAEQGICKSQESAWSLMHYFYHRGGIEMARQFLPMIKDQIQRHKVSASSRESLDSRERFREGPPKPRRRTDDSPIRNQSATSIGDERADTEDARKQRLGGSARESEDECDGEVFIRNKVRMSAAWQPIMPDRTQKDLERVIKERNMSRSADGIESLIRQDNQPVSSRSGSAVNDEEIIL